MRGDAEGALQVRRRVVAASKIHEMIVADGDIASVGMGVLPLQFPDGVNAASLDLDGTETFELEGLAGGLAPRQETPLSIRRAGATVTRLALRVRIDTPIETDYYRHGGILPYVLRQLLG